jgi:hypothetical protein
MTNGEEYERRKAEWKDSLRRQELDAERTLPPRPLTSEERDLLVWLLEHGPKAARSYLPQLEGTRAVRWCHCGCPSIRLVPASDAPDGEHQRATIISDFHGTTAEGGLVGLILFQKHGRIDLLEAYSVDGAVGPPEFGFPTIESLMDGQRQSLVRVRPDKQIPPPQPT